MATIHLARRGLGLPLPLYSEPRYAYSGMPVKLSETKDAGCRWIISHAIGETDSIICGAPTEEGHSYCTAHHARVFIKIPTEAA